MRQKIIVSEYTIRGNCSYFACRCCRTKYGWEHQEWCEVSSLTLPTCRDCCYYSERRSRCEHPALRRGKALPRQNRSDSH